MPLLCDRSLEPYEDARGGRTGATTRRAPAPSQPLLRYAGLLPPKVGACEPATPGVVRQLPTCCTLRTECLYLFFILPNGSVLQEIVKNPDGDQAHLA